MTNGNYNSSDWSASINTVMACIIVLFFYRSSLCDFLVHLVFDFHVREAKRYLGDRS